MFKYVDYAKNEGYIYWLFENNDTDYLYYEMMEFKKMNLANLI